MARQERSFKERKPFTKRVAYAQKILSANDGRIPIIIERYHKEKQLPLLDRVKFITSDYLTFGGLISIIRRKLQLNPSQSIYLIVNQKSVANHSMLVSQLYKQEKDPDGFLYIVYASMETFG